MKEAIPKSLEPEKNKGKVPGRRLVFSVLETQSPLKPCDPSVHEGGLFCTGTFLDRGEENPVHREEILDQSVLLKKYHGVLSQEPAHVGPPFIQGRKVAGKTVLARNRPYRPGPSLKVSVQDSRGGFIGVLKLLT